MTRLALSSWEIWRDILATNGDYIAEALVEFHTELDTASKNLAGGSLEAMFSPGGEFAALVHKDEITLSLARQTLSRLRPAKRGDPTLAPGLRALESPRGAGEPPHLRGRVISFVVLT